MFENNIVERISFQQCYFSLDGTSIMFGDIILFGLTYVILKKLKFKRINLYNNPLFS